MVLSPRKPTLVLDLDGTILDRNFWESLRLYLVPSARTGRIFSQAAPVLRRLGGKARLVGVTARCLLAAGNTRRWLRAQGVPDIPVLHAPFFLVTERARVRFKRRALRRLKDEGHRLVLGVGDRGSDLEAYVREGLFPVLLVPSPGGRRHRSLLERAARLGLEEGGDYVLFQGARGEESLWERVGAWIEEALEKGALPGAGRDLTPPPRR